MTEDRRLTKIINDFDRVAEKAAVLAGERAKLNAAVRISDLQQIMDLRRDVQTKEVTVAPTAADFNSLLNEVRDLRLSITLIGENLKAKSKS